MRYLKLFEELTQNKSIEELEKEYSYFHLSWDNVLLNDNSDKTFTFTPRTPEQPYGFEFSIIEDDFTKRISLGKSITDCLYALPEDSYGTWAIYGTKETNMISTKDMFKKCPIGYGEKFDLFNWINTLPTNQQKEISQYVGELHIEIGVSDLPIKYRNMFYGCVPDANKTDEFWYLTPLEMDYLGYIRQGENGNVYDWNDLRKIVPKFNI